MNIFDGLISDIFKKRTLKVKPETNLVSVMTTLASAGVLIENRYKVEATNEGTIIEFLSTELQWEVIKMLLDKMDDFIDKAMKESGLEDYLRDRIKD